MCFVLVRNTILTFAGKRRHNNIIIIMIKVYKKHCLLSPLSHLKMVASFQKQLHIVDTLYV